MAIREFILGTVVGAILGAGVYAWLARGAPADDQAKHAGMPAAPAAPIVKTETVVVSVGSPKAPERPAANPVAPGAAVPTMPREVVAPPAPNTVASAPGAANHRANDLSPAHARLIEPSPTAVPPPSVAQLHDRFATQDRDDRWSYYAENNLMDFLGPLAAQQGIEIASIVCRQTLCEIQAIAALEHADQRWGEIVNGIYGQPWGREFGGISSQSQGDDGSTVILTILQRTGAP